eukprot:TRINITY_DN93814_c0_g1_i1.p1 TRINITY_DN93814_c0_g1~~TRINITY_DN93814_c0_g1_i1.p1  ORF type:complete len:270 (-),score=41.37 TRINITY_DN93814_c0_g1_i1:261-1070(-)
MACVEGIYTSNYAAAPMKSLQKANIVAGAGIEGDRYHASIKSGCYSFINEPGRQLTLMSADAVESEMAKVGMEPFPIGDLRRNVIIRGISNDALHGFIGHQVTIGKSCRVFVHRLCVPCKYNESKNNRPGLMDKLWHVTGINCEVLVSGEVCLGDKVSVVPDSHEPSRINTAGKTEAFFTQPSKRTMEQHKELQMTPEKATKLLKSNQQAAERIEIAFRSAGVHYMPEAVWKAHLRQKRINSASWMLAAGGLIAILGMILARRRGGTSQ